MRDQDAVNRTVQPLLSIRICCKLLGLRHFLGVTKFTLMQRLLWIESANWKCLYVFEHIVVDSHRQFASRFHAFWDLVLLVSDCNHFIELRNHSTVHYLELLKVIFNNTFFIFFVQQLHLLLLIVWNHHDLFVEILLSAFAFLRCQRRICKCWG